MKEQSTWWIYLGAFSLLSVMIFVCSGLMGWAFMTLWNFAIVPTFHAPVLSFWIAWGTWILIGLIGSAFRSFTSSSDKK